MVAAPAALAPTPTPDLWDRVCREADELITSEPALADLMRGAVLAHASLEEVIALRVATALGTDLVPAAVLRRAFAQALRDQPTIAAAFRADVTAVLERDPATRRALWPVLHYKGTAALSAQRLAHWLWHHGRRDLAVYLQARTSTVFAVDVHPAASLGKGLMLDHATGFVAGETAVIEDDVSILQGVTLGGTGKETGDRHPKIRKGVMIGAGATILGNIVVGEGARVGAGSVVLRSVPPHTTVAGVPAKVVGGCGGQPSYTMDQIFEDPFDPVI